MVSFISEPIFRVGFFNITNTLLDTLLVDLIIIALIILVNKKLSDIPGMLQNFFEMFIDGFYKLTESVADKRADKIFPFFASFFIFILIANWTGIIPGLSLIGVYRDHELVPLFRAATSDLNTTLGLALVSAAATHVLSIKTLGVKEYLSRFISINPIYLFVGGLELISEITKVVSLSFRLFGNIFAGEVVLETISKMLAFVFPLPFLALEIIVGLIQALVFAMLTMAFMAILTTPHNEHAKEVVSK